MTTAPRVGVDVPFFETSAEVRAYCTAVEALGYDYVGFSEHIAHSRPRTPEAAKRSGSSASGAQAAGFTADAPWYESFTLLGFLAGTTRTLELSTAMLLLPLYHPVLAAKQAAEIHRLSDGRLRICASIGWIESEMQLLGVDPATRGARFEEQVQIMRALWSMPEVTHEGRFFSLDGAVITPRPAAPIPIWMGGGTVSGSGAPSAVTVRRMARIADGFKLLTPLSNELEHAAQVVDEVREAVDRAGRDPAAFGIEARISLNAVGDAVDDWARAWEFWTTRGVSHIGLSNRLAVGSVDELIRPLQRFSAVIRG